MTDGFIKVGAATPEIRVADCAFNAQSVTAAVKGAAEKGVKLLALPELCVTGYTCGDLFFQDTLLDAAEEALYEIARQTAELDITAAVGVPLRKNGKLFNCAAVISRGEVLAAVPKRFIPGYNEFYEQRHFSGEFKPVVFRCRELPDFTFGVEICEDLWAPRPPSVTLALSGASLILNLSASNEMIGKTGYRRELVKVQSARLICGYIYAGAGDGESTSDMVFGGHDIIAENGVILAESRLFENGLIVSEIDLGRLSLERRKNTGFIPENAAETVYFSCEKTPAALTRVIERNPFVPRGKSDRDERCEAILAMQSNGLKKRLLHTGAKSAVIGVSGGLDSCLALLVSVRAMDMLGRPRTDITAVTMPCFGTTGRTRGNAEKLCELLGVTLREIDIANSVKSHFADIGHDPAKTDVVFENAQARERTQILMDIANQENGLVIGTGDLSELALGWATYNGDHISMYGVNASVPKTLVRYIVGYYGELCGGELGKVLADILDTPVSPELLPPDGGDISQRTEELVGPYELHDFFLYHAIRWGSPPKKVFRLALYAFGGDYERGEILKWLRVFYRRFFSQQFKRSCMPDGAKVGSVTLSPRADWRMPSDASARVWLDEAEKLE